MVNLNGVFSYFCENKILAATTLGANATEATNFPSICNSLASIGSMMSSISENPQVSAAVTYLPLALLMGGVGGVGGCLLYKVALAAHKAAHNAYILWREADIQRARAAAHEVTTPVANCQGLLDFNTNQGDLLQKLHSLEKEKRAPEETKQTNSSATTQFNLDVQIKTIKDKLHALKPAEKLRLLRLVSRGGEKHSALKVELEAYFESLKPDLLEQTITDLKKQIDAHYTTLALLPTQNANPFRVRSQLADLDFEKDLLKTLTSRDVQPSTSPQAVDFGNLPKMDGFRKQTSLHPDVFKAATALVGNSSAMPEKNGNSFLAATLQTLFNQPSVVQAIPKAIQGKLIETELFEGNGVEDVLAKNPDLSHIQRTALKKIGELLRKKDLSKDDLKNLLQEMRLLNWNALPKGIHSANYNQMLTLLVLHDFYLKAKLGSPTDPVTDKDLSLIYKALKNIAPAEFPPHQEMKEVDPLNILKVLTDLMGLKIAILNATEKPDNEAIGEIADLIIYRQPEKGVLMPERFTLKTGQTTTAYEVASHILIRKELAAQQAQAAALLKRSAAAGKPKTWYYFNNNLGPTANNQFQLDSPAKDTVGQYGYLVIASKVEKRFFGLF